MLRALRALQFSRPRSRGKFFDDSRVMLPDSSSCAIRHLVYPTWTQPESVQVGSRAFHGAATKPRNGRVRYPRSTLQPLFEVISEKLSQILLWCHAQWSCCTVSIPSIYTIYNILENLYSNIHGWIHAFLLPIHEL